MICTEELKMCIRGKVDWIESLISREDQLLGKNTRYRIHVSNLDIQYSEDI